MADTPQVLRLSNTGLGLLPHHRLQQARTELHQLSISVISQQDIDARSILKSIFGSAVSLHWQDNVCQFVITEAGVSLKVTISMTLSLKEINEQSSDIILFLISPHQRKLSARTVKWISSRSDQIVVPIISHSDQFTETELNLRKREIQQQLGEFPVWMLGNNATPIIQRDLLVLQVCLIN